MGRNLEYRRCLLIDVPVLKDLKINFAPKIHMTMHESPYVGPPSPKVDDAWSDLIGNTSIRVTESELAQNGQKSVRLPGGGYLAWLGAFHQLHCAVSSSTISTPPPKKTRDVSELTTRGGGGG